MITYRALLSAFAGGLLTALLTGAAAAMGVPMGSGGGISISQPPRPPPVVVPSVPRPTVTVPTVSVPSVSTIIPNVNVNVGTPNPVVAVPGSYNSSGSNSGGGVPRNNAPPAPVEYDVGAGAIFQNV